MESVCLGIFPGCGDGKAGLLSIFPPRTPIIPYSECLFFFDLGLIDVFDFVFDNEFDLITSELLFIYNTYKHKVLISFI